MLVWDSFSRPLILKNPGGLAARLHYAQEGVVRTFIENRTARVVLVALLVLLLIPLVIMLGMMIISGGMMAQMGGMMGGGMMTVSILWSLLVVAALAFLIYLLTTGSGHRRAG